MAADAYSGLKYRNERYRLFMMVGVFESTVGTTGLILETRLDSTLLGKG